MAKEFAGAMILEVDGREIEVVSIDPTEVTGKRPVKVMNRSRLIGGFSRGIQTYALRIAAAVPLDQEINWADIEGATLTVYPASPGGQRTTYLDCYTEEVGHSYTVENEARQNITMFAVKKVSE